jgi:hypothetical protein
MKKLLGSTLALAMMLPAAANAELLKNVKIGGSLDVNAVSANNVNDLNTSAYDKVGTVQTRVMLNAGFDLLDDVHAMTTLTKNDRAWGETSANGNVSGTNGSQNLQDMANNVYADQAYIKIDKLFGALDTTLGRQFYGDPGDMVIYYGPRNDYGLTVTALDAARFDWNGENMGLTLLSGKTSMGHQVSATSDSKDKDLTGLAFHMMPMQGANAGAYVYERTTVNSGNGTGVIANDHLWVAGVKGKWTMGGAWAKAEVAKDFGENRTIAGGAYSFTGNYTGWAAKLDGGYKADLTNVAALTGWGEAAVGSGGQTSNRNFTAIASDYRPGSIAGRFWSGSADPIGAGTTAAADPDNGLANRVIFGVGVKATPAMLSKLTASLSWWNTRAQNETAYQVATAAKTNGDVMLGNEYDLDLTWKHSENVSVSAGAGSFQPGSAYKAVNLGVANSPATLCYADFNVKF